jgi:hypothetical protein
MKPLIYGLILGLALCGGSALGAEQDRKMSGDNLAMPAKSAKAASTPRRGTDMSQVEQRWGAPQSRLAAVGEPPITRWIYGNFTVYFEHNLVIHSVLHAVKDASNS